MDQIIMKITRAASVGTEEPHDYLASMGMYRLG